MKKAVLYLRFACVEQANEKEKAQQQYEYAEKYCTENGIEILRVFDEISVEPPRERYYFDKALKFAKQFSEGITYFLVMDYSRISRNYSEFKEIKEELQSYEIHILSILSNNSFCIEEFFDNLKQEK